VTWNTPCRRCFVSTEVCTPAAALLGTQLTLTLLLVGMLLDANVVFRLGLGGGFKYFYVHPYLGMISNLTNIFFKWVETTD